MKNKSTNQSIKILFPAIVLTVDEEDYLSLTNDLKSHLQSHSIALKGKFQDCRDIESFLKYLYPLKKKEELRFD